MGTRRSKLLAENEEMTTEEVRTLVMDAMCNFINNRGDVDGAAEYVRKRYEWMPPEEQAVKTAQVIKRIKAATKLLAIAEYVAEMVTDELNEMEYE
jgi:hypothetical protein